LHRHVGSHHAPLFEQVVSARRRQGSNAHGRAERFSEM
jgi:hypothetical protein